jgi:hypothetical protein
VIAAVPSSFARDAPFRIGWNYAEGTEAAVGDLLISVFQVGGSFFTCRAPLAQKAIEIPVDMITRFIPGPAFMTLQSVATGTGFLPLEQGNVRLSLSLSSTVDTGEASPDPTQPNILFR